MSRPSDRFGLLVAAFFAALVAVAVAGVLAAPDPMLTDPRRSTHLSGPGGASGFEETLLRLGVPVTRWERALYHLDAAPAGGAGRWLAVLAPSQPFADAELRGVAAWLAAGGSVFAAGATGLEGCFEVRVADLPTTSAVRPQRQIVRDSGVHVRQPRALLRARRSSQAPRRDCERIPPATNRAAAILTVGGDTVALSLSLESGARVVLLADSRYVANDDLKETDAGLIVVPLVVDGGASHVLVDEFHHGYGARGSLPAATLMWAVRSPAGWAMLQLVFAALLVLASQAVRFGPARHVVQRERRSPLDHVDALASGLMRARGDGTAVALLAGGLRRRLGRAGVTGQVSAGQLGPWLDSLSLATHTDAARGAVNRLKSALGRPADGTQVLAAARNVEEVWEALRPTTISTRS